MTSIVEKIRSRGFWQVIIRPVKYKGDRVKFTILLPLIEKTSIQLRGWDFPHIDTINPIQKDIKWIGQECDWGHFVESWRFYESGQFVHVGGIWQDWRDQSELWPAGKDWKPRALLDVASTVFHFSEIFEFAARLAFTEAGDDLIHIEIKLRGLGGRLLSTDDPQRMPLSRHYTATIDEFPCTTDVSRTELIANPNNLALPHVQQLFARFGWEPSLEHLKMFQPKARQQAP